jgi:type II secretory ATPase GspE/PulE/Tfp pilus assembly ATPase PilB-like protein
MLGKLNQPSNKIITLEDPIEYQIDGIVQSQVDESSGYTFAGGLRSILRQDPDIVMVGEIRDKETAEIAAQAAMTGHLVLSTLHTNSAAEAITRLINLGVRPYMVAGSLSLVVAQRLVRRLHTSCAQHTPLDAHGREIMQKYLTSAKTVSAEIDTTVPESVLTAGGCEECSHTGYLGQVAIAEGYAVDDELRELILHEAGTPEIVRHLRSKQSLISFAEDGILKVKAGLTTLAEVARVAEII